MKILVLNAGSSSLKYHLFETSIEAIALNQDRQLGEGSIERVTNMNDALREAFDRLGSALEGEPVEVVGHRIAHGGPYYQESTELTQEVEARIEEMSALAPLHNPHNLAGLRAARELLPHARHVGVFDTSFHHSIPPHAYVYGLPYEYLTEQKIRRYGFHGISHRYVSWRFAQMHARTRSSFRMITCHLGNGCSACAIEYGRSIDTSMGFTPLEGLIMGTRSGDIDVGAILYLINIEKQEPAVVTKMLNSMSGLKGISGVSNDMRDIITAAHAGNERAELAFEAFCYRVKKYIGSYLAAMNGADALIFTGGIGQNSPEVRANICRNLDALGITIDPDANGSPNREDRQIGFGQVPVWVIPTEEELLIARDALRVILHIPHD